MIEQEAPQAETVDDIEPKKLSFVSLIALFQDGTKRVIGMDAAEADPDSTMTMCVGGTDAIQVSLIPNYFTDEKS